jgi:hypothetical protein
MNEPAESVFGLLSLTAADPDKAPCNIELSIAAACTLLLLDWLGVLADTNLVIWE